MFRAKLLRTKMKTRCFVPADDVFVLLRIFKLNRLLHYRDKKKNKQKQMFLSQLHLWILHGDISSFIPIIVL